MYEINGITMLNELIYLNKDKLILFYFGASWCGPCKTLKKKINEAEYNKELKEMEIFYIDNDELDNSELFEIYNVKDLPTLFFVRLNNKLEIEILNKIIGYDWNGIKFNYGQLK